MLENNFEASGIFKSDAMSFDATLEEVIIVFVFFVFFVQLLQAVLVMGQASFPFKLYLLNLLIYKLSFPPYM